MQCPRFVLIGRDGVVNRRLGSGFVRSWTQFEFLPRAVEALRLLAQHGFQTIVISREEGLALGLMNEGELQALTSRFLLEVALSGGHILQVLSCAHPRESDCGCLAPLPGLLQLAIAEHSIETGAAYVICDSIADMEAASSLALPGTLVLRNNFAADNSRPSDGMNVAGCFYVAVQQLLSRSIPSMNEALTQPWPNAAATPCV